MSAPMPERELRDTPPLASVRFQVGTLYGMPVFVDRTLTQDLLKFYSPNGLMIATISADGLEIVRRDEEKE